MRRIGPGMPLGAALCALSASPDATCARPVGFRLIFARDTSRRTPAFPEGRPLQIDLWYPAAAAHAETMVYGDCVGLTAGETGGGSPEKSGSAAADFGAFLEKAGATRAEAGAWVTKQLSASRDAAPAAGRFPVVLIAQGNGQSAHDQAFLAERLATAGSCGWTA